MECILTPTSNALMIWFISWGINQKYHHNMTSELPAMEMLIEI